MSDDPTRPNRTTTSELAQRPTATQPSEPTEAELSRRARGVLHEPPDPRLDKQLTALGLGDTDEPAPTPRRGRSPTTPIDRPHDPRLEPAHLDARMTRLEGITVGLVAAVVFLTILVLILLVR